MSTPYRLSGNVEKTRCHLASKALRVAESCFLFVSFVFFFAGFIVSCAQDMVKQLQPAVLAFCEARKQHSMIQFRGIQRFRFFFGK